MKYKWIIGGVCLVLALTLVFTGVFRRTKPSATAGLASVEHSDPNRFLAYNVEMALQDLKGEIRWKLKIAKIEEGKSGTELFDVSGSYFPDKGGKPLGLKAETGQINPDMNRLVFNSGIRMERQGFALQGQKLVWNSKDGIIRMSKGVNVTADNFEGQGNTLVSDARLEKFRFEGENVWRVSAPLHSEGEQ